MKLSEKFYELSKDKQEEEAIKMMNKYHNKAEQWKRLAIKARIYGVKKPVNEKD